MQAVAAHLMRAEKLTRDEALDSIRKFRSIIGPNLGMSPCHYPTCALSLLSAFKQTQSDHQHGSQDHIQEGNTCG